MRRTIKVMLGTQGQVTPVSAWCKGNLAVHKGAGGWRVTHIPTGRACGWYYTRSQATTARDGLLALGDWDFKTIDEWMAVSYREQAVEVIRQAQMGAL